MNNEQKKHLLVYTKKLSKVLKIITPNVIFDKQLEGTSLGGYDPETNKIGVSHSATVMDSLFILHTNSDMFIKLKMATSVMKNI